MICNGIFCSLIRILGCDGDLLMTGMIMMGKFEDWLMDLLWRHLFSSNSLYLQSAIKRIYVLKHAHFGYFLPQSHCLAFCLETGSRKMTYLHAVDHLPNQGSRKQVPSTSCSVPRVTSSQVMLNCKFNRDFDTARLAETEDRLPPSLPSAVDKRTALSREQP